MRKIKKYWHCVLILSLLCFSSSVQAEKRLALVIGNSHYQYLGSLENPTNDADAMAQILQRLGFEVILKKDVKINEIGEVLRDFRSHLNIGDEVTFFYAGHGLEMDGENYLPAVDARIKSKHDVPLMSFHLKSILEELEEAKTKVNLVFLDACRNNPLANLSRGGKRGLAAPTEVSGTLISYAAKHGTVASDGETKHSPYTAALLSELSQHPEAKIEDILKIVKKRVKSETNGEQEPWVYGSLDGDFYFIMPKIVINISNSGPPSEVKLPLPKEKALSVEKKNYLNDECNQLWSDIKNATNSQEFSLFLKQCPQHKNGALAKIRQQNLSAQEEKTNKQVETTMLLRSQEQDHPQNGSSSMLSAAAPTRPSQENGTDPLYEARNYFFRGEEKQALNAIKTLLAQNPKEKGAYHLLHDIYAKKKGDIQLLKDLTQFIQDKNIYKIAYFHLGLVYQHLGLDKEMQTAFKLALQYDPRFFHPYLALRRYYLEQNQPEKAAEMYQKARAANPNLPENPPQGLPPRRGENETQGSFFPRERPAFDSMRFGPPPRFRP